MRFLVDECTGPRVASWLQELHHEVFSVYDDARGLDDESIIEIAYKNDYIIITNDKDFGELIFRMKVIIYEISNFFYILFLPLYRLLE